MDGVLGVHTANEHKSRLNFQICKSHTVVFQSLKWIKISKELFKAIIARGRSQGDCALKFEKQAQPMVMRKA